jgi:hypothetical protein
VAAQPGEIERHGCVVVLIKAGCEFRERVDRDQPVQSFAVARIICERAQSEDYLNAIQKLIDPGTREVA